MRTNLSKALFAVMLASLVFLLTPAVFAESGKSSLLDAFMKEYPEYTHAVRFDLNMDGIDELLATEEDRFPTHAVLAAVSADGKRLLSWKLFSRFSEFQYDPNFKALITNASGSGLNEFCVMLLSGNDLTVRHIGKNLSPSGDYYYDFTETVPGGENVPVSYSFGQIVTPEHISYTDVSFLEAYAISRETYDLWHDDYFQHLENIPLDTAEGLMRWMPVSEEEKPDP